MRPPEAAEARAPAALARERVLATKLIIGLFALGLCVVSNRSNLWPVVTWPMYHARTPEVPPPLVSVTHLRVTDEEGRQHLLRPEELVPEPRNQAAEELIEQSFSSTPDREEWREELVVLVERALGDEAVAEVAALERTWRVEPYATPPLDSSAPVREVVSGRFAAGARSGVGAAP
jgi:hypothetical protein